LEQLKYKNIKSVNKEKLKEIEEKRRKEYQENILKHLNEIEARQREVQLKNEIKIKSIIMKEEKNFERYLKHKNELLKEQEEIALLLLERQGHIIEKANLKDSSVNLNKLNA
jgi:hypothetical protein